MDDEARSEFFKMPIGELLILANTDDECGCSYEI